MGFGLWVKSTTQGSKLVVQMEENTCFLRKYIIGRYYEIIMHILDEILEIIYPSFCEICDFKLDKTEQYVCKSCLMKIEISRPPLCKRCSRQLAFEKDCCNECEGESSHLKQVWAWAIYENILKECIYLFKYKREKYIINLFEESIFAFLHRNSIMKHIDIVVPIPLHKSKLKQRTFNQAFLIGALIARHYHKPIKTALYKITKTEAQHNLTKYERILNVKRAFTVRNIALIKDNIILLVDDIFTTGVTINEGAKTLLNAGAKAVYGFTLARGR